VNRREAHLGALGLPLALSIRAAEPDDAFDPNKGLRARRLEKLATITPQSGKPLQSISATPLDEWIEERALYEKALRELIGPWPEKWPPL
jgi:hypothetical protein